MTIRFSREMQITGKEFLRQLPAAVQPLQPKVTGNKVLIADGSKRITITIFDEGTKELGSLDLPMEEVVFEFDGYSESEVQEFMTRYDERTMRAGGP